MRIVLDASAAIEIALDGRRAAQLTQALEEAAEVIAPDLFLCEVTNTIWKYHQFDSLSISSCDRAVDSGLGLVDALVSSKELHREAFLLARIARKPVYDMFYLALCRREDATLLTLDDALKKEALRQGIRLA